MANSLLEAILSGLVRAGQRVGGQMQENDRLNLQRRDALSKFRDDMEWRRQQAAMDRERWQKGYDLDVSREKQRGLERYQDRTLKMLDQGATDADSRNRFDITENRLSASDAANERYRNSALNAKESVPAKANPSGSQAVTAWRAGRKVPDPYSTSGGRMESPMNPAALDTLNALNMTGQFPKQGATDLDSWGRSEYGADWDLATPEQKQAIARKRGLM